MRRLAGAITTASLLGGPEREASTALATPHRTGPRGPSATIGPPESPTQARAPSVRHGEAHARLSDRVECGRPKDAGARPGQAGPAIRSVPGGSRRPR